MYKENEIIELHNFHGYYEQRWRFTHLWNGYYKIESTYSDKVLTCPTGPNNDVVRQTTFTKYSKHNTTYKISNLSTEPQIANK